MSGKYSRSIATVLYTTVEIGVPSNDSLLMGLQSNNKTISLRHSKENGLHIIDTLTVIQDNKLHQDAQEGGLAEPTVTTGGRTFRLINW